MGGSSHKTIILVMHDINFTSCYSDYIIAIKNGKVEIQGNVDEVINEKSLSQIYDMEFDIVDIKNNKIAVYY